MNTLILIFLLAFSFFLFGYGIKKDNGAALFTSSMLLSVIIVYIISPL